MLNRRVQILFDQSTYDLISNYANNQNLTFSEALRQVAQKSCKPSKTKSNKRKLALAKIDKIRLRNNLHLTSTQLKEMVAYGRH